MPKTRNLVKHIGVETAKGTRKCHANSTHEIDKGEKHLAIRDGMARENICLECAPKVLKVASEHIAKVKADLGI